MSSIIAVDIGNTFVGAAEFTTPVPSCHGQLPIPRNLWQRAVEGLELANLSNWLPETQCRWRVGSVHSRMTQSLAEWVKRQRPADTLHILRHQDFPLSIEVDAPAAVGIDRLAAAVAANCIRDRHKPAIVIDTGSAVTVDVVSAGGVFRGGHIFPGMLLSLRALSDGTDQLPSLLPLDDDVPVIGKNTHDAMQAGVFWSVLGAIREIVQRLRLELKEECDVIATGGDIRRLLPHLDFPVRHEPHLVLAGIVLTDLDRDCTPI